ncbi:MAG: hypothetical protein EHM17_15070 [Verrucomicrobiaceae bacterium]|nr:MAG: hypothetical protein EHM17_15070 [Verrucomicrobiaceae bacterium]
MNRNDIIAMARDAGFESNSLGMTYTSGRLPELLERFAALVAAAEREHRAFEIAECYRCGWDGGVKAEREACAEVCDKYAKQSSNPMNFAYNCAVSIRARGEK